MPAQFLAAPVWKVEVTSVTVSKLPASNPHSPAPERGAAAAPRRVPTQPQELPEGSVARYARHLTLPGIGLTGQQRLFGARVLAIGAGGLGAPVLQYLAAAGVGTLGVVDDDVVSVSNLQRQVIHTMDFVGKPKVDSARAAIAALNPQVAVETHNARLTAENADEILDAYDLVVDGSDNFQTRYLVSDRCAELGIPLVWGSINRFDGQVSVFTGECTLRDLYPEPPAPGTVKNCAEAGAFGVLPGVVGTLMAAETIKLVTGFGEPLVGRVAVWDGARAEMRTFAFSPQPEESAALRHRAPAEEPPAAACATPTAAGGVVEEPVTQWPRLVEEGWRLVDVREPREWVGGVIDRPTLEPLSALQEGNLGALADLDRDTPLALYCAAGVRSAKAARILADQGFTRVISLAGGITAWWETL